MSGEIAVMMDLLKAGNGQDREIESLRRAKEAARKGAALARKNGAPE